MGNTLELTGAPLQQVVLALGADMKNAVALGHDRQVMMSPFTGPLDTPEAVERFEQVVGRLSAFPGYPPAVVAIDLHPDMQSSRLGRALARERNLPLVEVQHHHAHAAACLAENGCRDGLVLVMDGTGWGGDGTIWGAELLDVRNDGTFSRLASFSPVHLPGGDAAVRRPVRQVIGRWVQAGIEVTDRRLRDLGINRQEADVWVQQCRRHVNAPLTHAAGRLFDSFSAVLGLAPRAISYEGEPAILLEAAAREWGDSDIPVLPFDVLETGGLLLIDWAPAFRRLGEVVPDRGNTGAWAMAAHVAVARAASVMIDYAVSRTSVRRVSLSGGVFMNRILNLLLDRQMETMGVKVLRHRVTPPGDGCIALGQVMVVGSQGRN